MAYTKTNWQNGVTPVNAVISEACGMKAIIIK